MLPDFDTCYEAVKSRDERFDGWFTTAVTSTGIYCRPSCPALTPKRANVRFFPTPAAAQAAGFRACKRCRPDCWPGSPEWNVRADLVGRAMALIGDGIVEREGVAGLASRLGYSERHVHRQLAAELGAGPQALARAHRAQTARILIETTPLAFSTIAFSSGFASVRQFNETVREVFALSPTELRRKQGPNEAAEPGSITLRLTYRRPFDPGVIGFIGARAIPGVEELRDGVYRRSLRLPHGSAIAGLSDDDGHVRCRLRLTDMRDLPAAVQRCRRLLDLDADPVAVDERLSGDRLLRRVVRRRPGIRLPGTVDPSELALRAVLGQQVSVAAARTLTARLVMGCGKPLTRSDGSLTHEFPAPEAVAASDLAELGIPGKRRAALQNLAGALADATLVLDPGVDRLEARSKLRGLPGIGPWTESYVAMRALGEPDAFLPSDLGVRKAMERIGYPTDPPGVLEQAEGWRPWRSYAVQYLWSSLDPVPSISTRRKR